MVYYKFYALEKLINSEASVIYRMQFYIFPDRIIYCNNVDWIEHEVQSIAEMMQVIRQLLTRKFTFSK